MQSIRMFISFLSEVFSRRNVIYELTKRDFKAVYLGSYLGILWAFALPIANILIFWLIFQVGFQSKPVGNAPYVLWLVSGIVPWFFFSDCVNNGATSILQNSFIVKKVAFSIGILPIIKILSGLIIHLFFILLIFTMFLTGLSWITSSVVIFFRDLRPLITIFLQVGFYLTPIFWNINIFPAEYHILMKFNPIFYVVEGYRDCFITKVWFWEHWGMTLYFWFVTVLTLACGALIFRRLRPHFADVI